jgi:hypothetical protein
VKCTTRLKRRLLLETMWLAGGAGAASGVWGARTYYSLAAAGRNRGGERGVRLE